MLAQAVEDSGTRSGHTLKQQHGHTKKQEEHKQHI